MLNRHVAILKHAILKQAKLLNIMLRVLVLLMQHDLHAAIHFPLIFFFLTRNNQNTTISIFNTKKIRHF